MSIDLLLVGVVGGSVMNTVASCPEQYFLTRTFIFVGSGVFNLHPHERVRLAVERVRITAAKRLFWFLWNASRKYEQVKIERERKVETYFLIGNLEHFFLPWGFFPTDQ